MKEDKIQQFSDSPLSLELMSATVESHSTCGKTTCTLSRNPDSLVGIDLELRSVKGIKFGYLTTKRTASLIQDGKILVTVPIRAMHSAEANFVVIIGHKTKVQVFPAAAMSSQVVEFLKAREEEEEEEDGEEEEEEGCEREEDPKKVRNFWKCKIKDEIESRYPGGLTIRERKPTFFLRDRVNMGEMVALFQDGLGLKLSPHIERNLLADPTAKLILQPFDILKFKPRITELFVIELSKAASICITVETLEHAPYQQKHSMLLSALKNITSGWIHTSANCPIMRYWWGRILYQLAIMESDRQKQDLYARQCIDKLSELIKSEDTVSQYFDISYVYLCASVSWCLIAIDDPKAFETARQLTDTYWHLFKEPKGFSRAINWCVSNLEMPKFYGEKQRMKTLFNAVKSLTLTEVPEIVARSFVFFVKYVDTFLKFYPSEFSELEPVWKAMEDYWMLISSSEKPKLIRSFMNGYCVALICSSLRIPSLFESIDEALNTSSSLERGTGTFIGFLSIPQFISRSKYENTKRVLHAAYPHLTLPQGNYICSGFKTMSGESIFVDLTVRLTLKPDGCCEGWVSFANNNHDKEIKTYSLGGNWKAPNSERPLPPTHSHLTRSLSPKRHHRIHSYDAKENETPKLSRKNKESYPGSPSLSHHHNHEPKENETPKLSRRNKEDHPMSSSLPQGSETPRSSSKRIKEDHPLSPSLSHSYETKGSETPKTPKKNKDEVASPISSPKHHHKGKSHRRSESRPALMDSSTGNDDLEFSFRVPSDSGETIVSFSCCFLDNGIEGIYSISGVCRHQSFRAQMQNA
eukprot:TRINITY_DN6471_c0_g1_i1.p1 TRINITY_DN6471_c0_g1~~TRINITY_DN6471_c0_g1_i1.p1  ORF type:complete len:903 (+),score=163.97 TRINITY_DN6471_c0_g1_i1:288-2711(+)